MILRAVAGGIWAEAMKSGWQVALRIDPGGFELSAAHSGRGQSLALSLFGIRRGGTGSESEAVIACLEYVAMVGKADLQGGRHLGVAEYAGPLTETEVSGDHDAGPFIQLAEQVEQERPAYRAEWQIAQVIENDEAELEEPFGNLTGLVDGPFLFQRINQIDSGEEEDFPPAMLYSLNAMGHEVEGEGGGLDESS